jgi:medium-chain acyl-[acyl-carrier-protein] hydrolase
MGSPWLIRYKSNPAASVRLFCFHCAGGSASEFRSWPAHLTGKIELLAVQLPGREGRVNEAFIASMDELIGGVVEAIISELDKPYVIFGHSFGALGGFEVIRELRSKALPQPFLFIPAGRRGAQVTDKKPPIASLPKDELIAQLRKRYGNQLGPIWESAELRDMLIPQLHADIALSESYRFRDQQPLDCPIVAFAGVAEKSLNADALNAWSVHTSRSFQSRRFPGGHFFIRESQPLVIEAIKQAIVAVRREQSAGSHPLLV